MLLGEGTNCGTFDGDTLFKRLTMLAGRTTGLVVHIAATEAERVNAGRPEPLLLLPPPSLWRPAPRYWTVDVSRNDSERLGGLLALPLSEEEGEGPLEENGTKLSRLATGAAPNPGTPVGG